MAFSRQFLSFLFAISIISVSLPSCKSQKPMQGAVQSNVPKAPNYSDLRYWAAHPDKKDSADCIPLNCNLKDEQASADVDVFFLHPTTLINGGGWNGDVDDDVLNKKTDSGPIQYQASIFNGAGRIYAPRYRQAHYHSYFTKDTATAMAAFELAYQDVKTAFEYYLEHWNNGRPVIIASHSQGTTHAKRLLKEYFDGKNLKNRLVVAYLAGMPITKNYFTTIPVCETPEQTGCFCSWRTFKEGYEPRRGFLPRDSTVAVVNPLSWNTQTQLISKDKHQGFVLVGFKAIGKNNIETQIHNGTLWASKPSFKGSILFRTKNYHIGDFNLFYFNIREDAKRRVGLFWKR
jgi:Protein of unknown function (DUF3089)